VLVNLPGGQLLITWADNNHVFMTGPAEEVFQGELSEAFKGCINGQEE
jgi:diaminopimelate epimerase